MKSIELYCAFYTYVTSLQYLKKYKVSEIQILLNYYILVTTLYQYMFMDV
jgi:hypothetical protein